MRYEQVRAKSHCGSYQLIQDLTQNQFEIHQCRKGNCQTIHAGLPITEAWNRWQQIAPESFDLGFPHNI